MLKETVKGVALDLCLVCVCVIKSTLEGATALSLYAWVWNITSSVLVHAMTPSQTFIKACTVSLARSIDDAWKGSESMFRTIDETVGRKTQASSVFH